MGRYPVLQHVVCTNELHFWHQRKEEDYELQPGWLPQLSALHKKIGWEFFDQGIRRGQVVDYGESGLRKTAPLSGVPVEGPTALGPT